MVQTEKNFGIAAIKAGMDEKTARKYHKLGKLPSELEQPHTWRTRQEKRGVASSFLTYSYLEKACNLGVLISDYKQPI